MTIENLTNENYESFRRTIGKIIVVLGVDSSFDCRLYKSELEEASEKFPFIKFGYVDMEGRKIPEEMKRHKGAHLPLTILMEYGGYYAVSCGTGVEGLTKDWPTGKFFVK